MDMFLVALLFWPSCQSLFMAPNLHGSMYSKLNFLILKNYMEKLHDIYKYECCLFYQNLFEKRVILLRLAQPR